ncbi:DNA-directed RNA polymerase omega subunit [Secundilactobacillus oryzae JCM 18671]|uniref:DNA-directed RNA polymerase subunit omega n=1 Tax=Secundilactobacillus oryzae JCM 18671 TaxID=1291743 RepID=A0A081BFV8_9LACO|nr:DNA-directed RNA polymerase subunit omega [Secundilactobacillus oryzae]GAK46926.1 DNA-directed RNA polymerase omega subunit [Secundilactobacillus oryzae JCM 18671]
MLLYPSVDDLLKQVNSRYSLIMLASKRAHELDAGATPLLSSYESPKTIGRALEEIAAGVVSVDEEKSKTK